MRTRVETEQHGTIAVVALAGEVDRFRADEVRRALGRAEERARDVVLDLSAITFIDSTALGLIAAAAKRSRRSGRALVLVVEDHNLRRTLRITAIDLLCAVHESRSDALAALADATGEAARTTP